MGKNRKTRCCILFCISYLFVPASVCLADIIYVDVSADGADNGSGWENAYNFLQNALTNADQGDEIWVAEGTYYPDCNPLYPEGTGDRDATFQLLPGVALYGGFRAGSGEWQDRDPNAHPTILSGDLNGNDGPDFTNYDENTFHVVTGSGTDVTAIIDGFTITAGYSNIGAGMYNESGSPTIRNCFFYANYAQDWSDSKGAGMYNNNSNPTIINC